MDYKSFVTLGPAGKVTEQSFKPLKVNTVKPFIPVFTQML